MLILRVLENILQPCFIQKMTVLNLLEKISQDPQLIIDIFVNYDCDLDSPNIYERHEVLVRWHSPSYGWVALNVDGAGKGCPGPSGAGGMLDLYGRCMGVFTARLGSCTAMREELMALKKGLELAWNKRLSCVDVRMDNQACVCLMNVSLEHLGPNVQLVKQCRELIARPQWIVTISHCYREANRVADWLANKGVVQEATMEVDFALPTDLAALVREDNLAVALPRNIIM